MQTRQLQFLKDRARNYTGLAIIWLLATIALNSVEWIYNVHSISAHSDRWCILASKLLSSAFFWVRVCSVFFFIYLTASFRSIPFANRLIIVLFLVVTIVQTMLIVYFTRSLLPLGADLYGYSTKEVFQTAASSGGLPVMGIVLFLIFLVGLWFLFKKAGQRPFVPFSAGVIILIVSFCCLFLLKSSQTGPQKYASEFDANLVLDKSGFFTLQSWEHFIPRQQIPETDIYADSYAVNESRDLTVPSFLFPDKAKFPFYHQDNTPDVLSPFFARPLSGASPNIVLLIVEGLGRAFTNEDAYLGNFTPFLDSLSRHSLYWKNFISSGGRTFAALPSLLGSLPFGKEGFLEMGEEMPRQYSLINILKANGYQTSFYYGGDAHFDNMNIFLKKNSIDRLEDGRTFSTGYNMLPAVNGFSWGYDDASLYRRQLSDQTENMPPQLSIVLTVATHSPFLINNQQKYDSLFERQMTILGMDEETKQQHRSFKPQYASVLYADDALRELFSTYARTPGFEHTIFIITGDHRMPEIPMRSKIDRYHVPLLIFSPLIQRPAVFESMSTHFDLTPSLLAFLSKAYGIRRPSNSVWVGAGLDTARAFRNRNEYPLMQTKADLLDFISGEYHLNGTTLFHLSSDLNETPATDDQRKMQLSIGFNEFIQRNNMLIPGRPLMPDSAFSFMR